MPKVHKSSFVTSGVICFDKSALEVLDMIMKEDMEHHYGITYSELRQPLYLLRNQLDLLVFELT